MRTRSSNSSIMLNFGLLVSVNYHLVYAKLWLLWSLLVFGKLIVMVLLLGLDQEMGSLQGPVVCPSIRAKQVVVYQVPINNALMKSAMIKSTFWGYNHLRQRTSKTGLLARPMNIQRRGTVQCTYSSSSNGSGSRAENFKENDEDFVNSSVIEAGRILFDYHCMRLNMLN